MMKYKILKDELENVIGIERTTEDGLVSIIPINESNSDYQAYLKSLEETNE